MAPRTTFLVLAVLAAVLAVPARAGAEDARAAEKEAEHEVPKFCDLSKIYQLAWRDGALKVSADQKQDWSKLYRELMSTGRFRTIRIAAKSSNWSASMGGRDKTGTLIIDLMDEKAPLLDARFELDGDDITVRIRGSRVRIERESDDGETFALLRSWGSGASLYRFEGGRATDTHAATLGELVLKDPSVGRDFISLFRSCGIGLAISRHDPFVVRDVTQPPAAVEGHAATRVATLLSELGSDDFAVRDRASKALAVLVRDPAFVRHLVEIEGGLDDLESQRRVARILEATGDVAARFRLIRDEKLETDREYLSTLAESHDARVSAGAKRLLAELAEGE